MKPSTVFMLTGTIAALTAAGLSLAFGYTQCVSASPVTPNPQPLSRELRREIELRCLRQSAHITHNTEWMHALDACRKDLRHAFQKPDIPPA